MWFAATITMTLVALLALAMFGFALMNIRENSLFEDDGEDVPGVPGGDSPGPKHRAEPAWNLH